MTRLMYAAVIVAAAMLMLYVAAWFIADVAARVPTLP